MEGDAVKGSLRWRAGAGIVGVLLAVTISAPAFAQADIERSTPSADNNTLELRVEVGGQLISIDDALDDVSLHEQGFGSAGTVSPQLIDFGQWWGCWNQNDSSLIFGEYTFYWNGAGHDVRLRCGEDTSGVGWGYKHITVKHEADWQAKYDEAISLGWNPAADGLGSWDDLMHVATGTAITYPGFVGDVASNNTRCVVARVYFVERDTGIPALIFNSRAVFAVDSDRLITAFPQSSSTC